MGNTPQPSQSLQVSVSMSGFTLNVKLSILVDRLRGENERITVAELRAASHVKRAMKCGLLRISLHMPFGMSLTAK